MKRDYHLKPTREGRPTRGRKARRKLRADGQEPHRRPTRHDELAQHSEVVWFTRGGKCGGCAEKHRALTWGDLPGAIRAEVSRRHSSRRNEPECEDAHQNCRKTHPTKGRTEWGYPNRVTDAPADNAGRRGMDESRHDGKHVSTQGDTPVSLSREPLVRV